jgi:hypothetical protein
MARFMLAVHTRGNTAREPMSEEEMRQGYEQVAGLEREMRAAGALVFSGRLQDADAAFVVRSSNGKAMTTDGPFTESKEIIGGFYIVEAENRDAALAWAEKTSAAISMPIEVRPFLASVGPDESAARVSPDKTPVAS